MLTRWPGCLIPAGKVLKHNRSVPLLEHADWDLCPIFGQCLRAAEVRLR